MLVLKCPNCDGKIEIDDSMDTCFCKYCGYQIQFTNQDEAVVEAKLRIKEMEYQQERFEKELEFKRYVLDHKTKVGNKLNIIYLFCVVICVIMLILFVDFYDTLYQMF